MEPALSRLVCIFLWIQKKKTCYVTSNFCFPISSKPNTERVEDLRFMNSKAMHGVLKAWGELNRPECHRRAPTLEQRKCEMREACTLWGMSSGLVTCSFVRKPACIGTNNGVSARLHPLKMSLHEDKPSKYLFSRDAWKCVQCARGMESADFQSWMFF